VALPLGPSRAASGAVEDREVIAGNWKDLSELERRVVRLRLVDELPSARSDGASASHRCTSRALRRALERLAPAA
jgi:hypothetical protein